MEHHEAILRAAGAQPLTPAAAFILFIGSMWLYLVLFGGAKDYLMFWLFLRARSLLRTTCAGSIRDGDIRGVRWQAGLLCVRYFPDGERHGRLVLTYGFHAPIRATYHAFPAGVHGWLHVPRFGKQIFAVGDEIEYLAVLFALSKDAVSAKGRLAGCPEPFPMTVAGA